MAATATPKSKAPGALVGKVVNPGKTAAKVAPAKKVDPKTQAARDRIKDLDKKAAPAPAAESKELPRDQQVDPKSGPLPPVVKETKSEAPAPVKEKKARKPRTPKDPAAKAESVTDKFAATLKAKHELLASQAKEIAALKKELKAAREAHKADLKKVAALGKAKVRKPRKVKST